MQCRGVAFNGKFLTARPTGVHRVAKCLLEHLDVALDQPTCEGARWRVIAPRNADYPLQTSNIHTVRRSLLTWQLWEQLELPARLGADLLVNLCNMAPLADHRGITLIHDAHVFLTPTSSTPLFNAWYRFALPRIAAQAAQIVTVSEFSKAMLVQQGIAPTEKISVIYNGGDHLLKVAADPSRVRELGLEGRPYVLAAANTQHHKNIRLLFELFEKGDLGDVALVLVGPDGPETLAAAGLRLPASAILAGYVDDPQLRALYEHATCLAFPSLTEGFGLPPVEAMSLGCLTIASPAGALREVCQDGAIYASPTDPGEWRRAILQSLSDPELRRRQIAAGRARSKTFTWSTSATQWKQLIEAQL